MSHLAGSSLSLWGVRRPADRRGSFGFSRADCSKFMSALLLTNKQRNSVESDPELRAWGFAWNDGTADRDVLLLDPGLLLSLWWTRLRRQSRLWRVPMDRGSFGGSRCSCSYECCPFRGTAPPVVMPKWWVTGSFAPSWTGHCWGSSSDGLPGSLLFSAGPWVGQGARRKVRAYFTATLEKYLAPERQGIILRHHSIIPRCSIVTLHNSPFVDCKNIGVE